jgi:hypothetical protein
MFALLGTQEAASLDSVSEWRQDLLAIYAQKDAVGDPSVLAMWRIRFDSEADASEYNTTLAPLGLATSQKGREIAIRVSNASGDAFEALDPNACPSQKELEQAVIPSDGVSASLLKIGGRFLNDRSRARLMTDQTERRL